MAAFSSDIISHVVAAADPRRAEAARRKLAASAASAPTEFGALVQPTQPQTGGATHIMPTARVDRQLAKRPVAGETPVAVAYRALGAMLLQKAFEAMTPTASFDGASRSGMSMWKSMLAQQFAESASATMFRLPNALSDAGGRTLPPPANTASAAASEGSS